ncbi:MAG: DUF4153 domain-containing protein [Bacteroidales bacterium]|nr:DUF4153 domain-containing protein [Bacteroidales bacterium]
MKYFNPGNFAKSLKNALRRFPVTLGFVALLTVLLMIQTLRYSIHLDIKVDGSLCYFAVSGIWISMFFCVLKEELKKKWVTIAFVASLVLLGIDTCRFYVMTSDYIVKYGTEITLARVAIFVSCMLFLLVLPSIKKKDDIESVNFSLSLVGNAAQSLLVAFVGAVGWLALFWGTMKLFDVDVDGWLDVMWEWPLIFLGMTVPLVVFFCRMPQGEDMHRETFEASKFYKGILEWLLIPLVLCFMGVLYFYLLKIVFEWSLPQGGVVWMVSAMMAGVSIVVLMLNPLIVKGGSEYHNKIMKLLPILSLPLVVLMAVAIARRMMDYGISVNRLYVVALCIYCFIIVIGLILNKGRRVNFMLVSFGVLFLLTSAQPMNIVNTTMTIMYGRLKEKIAAYPPDKLPIDRYDMNRWLYSLPDSSGGELASIIDELREYRGSRFDTTLVEELWGVRWSYDDYIYTITNNDSITKGNAMAKEFGDNSFPSYKADTLFVVYKEKTFWSVPKGFSMMEEQAYYEIEKRDSLIVDGDLIVPFHKETVHLKIGEILERKRIVDDEQFPYIIEGVTESGKRVVYVIRRSEFTLLEYKGWCEVSGSFLVFYNDDIDF